MSRRSEKGYTDIPITIGFDNKMVVGQARISDQALKACPANRFVLSPAYIIDELSGIKIQKATLAELSFIPNQRFIDFVNKEAEDEDTDSEL